MGVLDSSALQMLLWWWLLKNWLLWATVPFLYPWVVSWIPSPGIERNLLQKVLQEMFCRKNFAENVLQKCFAKMFCRKCFAEKVLQKCFAENVWQKKFCKNVWHNVLQKSFAGKPSHKCFAKMFCKKFCRKCFAENVLQKMFCIMFCKKVLQESLCKNVLQKVLQRFLSHKGVFLRRSFSFSHFQEGSFIFKHKIKKYFFSLGSSLSVSSTVWWQKSPGRWSGVSLAPARKC